MVSALDFGSRGLGLSPGRGIVLRDFLTEFYKLLSWNLLGFGNPAISLLRSRSDRSHVTLPNPTRLLQTDIHSFLGVLRFCLLGPMSLSFSCHCIRCTNHRREHSQQNESHTLIGLLPRKECMSV